MAKKDLKYFMRSMEPEIITVPGPESIKDENGEVIQFEIKKLTQEEITRINDAYRKHSIATDKRGNPLVSNGEVIWKTERDGVKATRHLIVEALQYPNLKDPDLMKSWTLSKRVAFSSFLTLQTKKKLTRSKLLNTFVLLIVFILIWNNSMVI